MQRGVPPELGVYEVGPPRYGAAMATSSRRNALFAIAVSIGFATIAIPGPAAAAPPDTFSFDEQADIPAFIECDGFAIDLSTTSHVTVRSFFDSDGNVQRVSIKVMAIDVLTNNVTQRQVLNRGVFEEVYTRIGDTDEFRGTLVGFRFIGIAEAEGLVIQDVGRIVYSPEHNVVSLAGQHDAEELGEEGALCAALT